MSIRLAAFDLDGTLLNSQKQVTPAVQAAARLAAAHGIEVVLNTGRMLSECGEVLAALPEVRYVVACTGALVLNVKTGSVLASRCLSPEEGRLLYARLRPFDALLGYFADGRVHNDAERLRHAERYAPAALVKALQRIHAPEEDMDGFVVAWDGPVEKIHLYFRSAAARDCAREALAGLDFFVTTTDTADLEIMRRDADKGTGLQDLAAALGLKKNEVLAMGDNENDRRMLEYAGTAAAPENALPAIRKIADIVTPSNDADGAAWLLRRLAEGDA